MLPLGSKLPDFSLPEPAKNNKEFSSADIRANHCVVIAFICNHCPYVIHLADWFSMLAIDYQDKNLTIVAINSNDFANYPADSPQNMVAEVNIRGYTFPYLFDETQQVAKQFQAACTPDFFLFNTDRELVYRGQFDDSRPGNDKPITGLDLRAAIDATLMGEEPDSDQKPSIGCNIKWKG